MSESEKLPTSDSYQPATSAPHRRDTVLRVLTDLFVHNSEQQSPEERSMQDNVMFNLLSEAGIVMRQEVAERLAAHKNPPSRVMQLLAIDDLSVAKQVLMHSPVLSDQLLADIAAHTTPEHLEAIAQRAEIGELTTEAILRSGNHEMVLAVAENSHAAFSGTAMDLLFAQIQQDGSLADILLQRDDMRSDILIALLWQAAPEQRARIVKNLSDNNNGLDALLNQRPPLSAPIQNGSQTSRATVHRGLVSMLMAGKSSEFAGYFAKILGIHASMLTKIMADENGEPFAIACKAAGFETEAFTTLALLYNPVIGKSVDRVFALGEFYKSLPDALCWRILLAWSCASPADKHNGFAKPALDALTIHDEAAQDPGVPAANQEMTTSGHHADKRSA